MAILSDRLLFDFEGYNASIKGMEAATASFAQSAVSWLNRVGDAYETSLKLLNEYRTGLGTLSVTSDKADQKIADFIARIGQSGTAIQIARQSQNDLSEAQKLNAQVVIDLTNKLAGLYQKLQSLDPTQKDFAKQQRAILSEVKVVSRAIDAQTKSLQVGKSAIDAAEGSINLLKKQTSDLKKTLDSLPNAYDKSTGKINEQNRAATALNEQYQKNIALLNRVEQGQKNFRGNVGNYPQAQQQASGSSAASSALAVGGRLAGAGLAIAGIDSALGAIQKVGEITLEFDSLDSALKVVSNDTVLFAQRQAMLSRMSDNLGQDLSVVEKTYTNLTASSKGTRLEGAATDQIYEQIVGTMGRLKKPTEEVEGALLAVGQMMSKGTVQSEELRGQLGERIPGAFNIAAKAMGVTTQKLGDMLKNGEVVASEFLPKFAAELERTFNPNHEQRVEGLAANLARLRNEGVEWVKSINIGDAAGDFIGNITEMGRAVRLFFSSSVQQANVDLENQTNVVNNLEAALPPLLARYDELKSKSKLSSDEQKELHTVVNNIVGLIPSAATGFDTYGNALDVNKSKVTAFAQAQRELNAELNKSAIKALQEQTSGGYQRAQQTQDQLNKGTKQQSFNLKPYFLMSDEEKRQSNSKGAGKRREVALSDNDKRDLSGQLQEENRKIELSITQRLQLGDKLNDADKKYIDEGNSINLKRYKAVEGYNEKIAELDNQQASLFIKGDKDSLKQRESVVKELSAYKKKVADILNPSTQPQASSDKPGKSQAQINKERAAAEKRTRDALGVAKSTQEKGLALLGEDRQDGKVDEQTFIEKELQTTLSGVNKRLGILRQANKTESKEYQELLEEKANAERKYLREQLQLDLKNNKLETDKKVSALSPTAYADGENDLSYIEDRHKLIEAGIQREQSIIKEAGLQESQLMKVADTKLLDEQADYLKRKAKAEEKGWKEQLDKTKDALKAIDQESHANLEKKLADLDDSYQKQVAKIQKQMAKGKLSEPEGEKQLSDLKIKYLADATKLTQGSFKSDEAASRALVQGQIDDIEAWLKAAKRTPEEIASAEAATAKLRKELEENLSKDKMDLATKVADHQKATSKATSEGEVKQAKFSADEQKKLWDQSIATIETIQQSASTIISNSYQKQADDLTTQKDRELALVGDNAEAKARIEQNYNKQIGEIRRKQAIAERAAAVFQIGINTAVAITDVLRTGGGAHYLDFGVSAGILSALITASGLAQITAVLAAPMPPAYFVGKQASDAYAGPASIAEKGAELLVNKQGQASLYSKPTLINTRYGDTIYTASETSRILADMRRSDLSSSLTSGLSQSRATMDRLQQGRINEQALIYQLAMNSTSGTSETAIERAFGRALDNRPQEVTTIDFEGMKRGQRRANAYHEYMEKRSKW